MKAKKMAINHGIQNLHQIIKNCNFFSKIKEREMDVALKIHIS
jgi:hypothetical protein